MLTARSIYLSKKNKLIVDRGSHETPVKVVATFVKNLEAYGFTVSKALFDRLLTLSVPQLTDLYGDTTTILKEMVGAHRVFKPFYPNFPKQVMEASEAELYINAILHYWLTDSEEKQVVPQYEKEDRPELDEETKLRVIDLGSISDFEKLFTKLVGSNSSISATDKEIVSWFVENYKDDIKRLVPDSIPQKEQLSFLIAHTLKHVDNASFLVQKLKTPTDVLRAAVAMSNGDVSLAEPTKFRNFTRKERKFLVLALEYCYSDSFTEDLLRWSGRWTRLAHNLHIGEYKKDCPNIQESFDIIRNKKPFVTFNSKVESAIRGDELEKAVSLLSTRPGDFARRLDKIVRTDGRNYVIEAFSKVTDKISTPVLLQTYQHFQNRENKQVLRSFFPKGNVGKLFVTENKPLAPLDHKVAGCIVSNVRKALVDRFSKLPSLGSVYIDKQLKTQFIPSGLRSASKSLRTLARGSRVDFGFDGDTIRFFLWWQNGGGRTDIDLSSTVFTANWTHYMDVSYYNLKDWGCHHSGDIVSAPHGACEFIDITISKFLEKKLRYVMMCINSFTGQSFSSLPECFAGWMGRANPNSGEVFEPKTVLDKVDVTANTKVCIPVVLDLVERQVIWSDLALTSRARVNNVHRNRRSLNAMGRAVADLSKPTLYDLFDMHAEARGEKVENKKYADTVFSLHEGITPFDSETIMADFMV
ncbi:MAG: hypothetical protein DWQ19_10435 [Crenarchaeota archaeon]|nr:MAG: hypothetical protein DWQ19_10435 [Thermoproteota archaeon]